MEGLKFPYLQTKRSLRNVNKPSKDMGESYRGMQINLKTVSVLYIIVDLPLALFSSRFLGH